MRKDLQLVKFENGVPLAPIITYEKNGSRITIMGIFHIASKEFFEKLQKEIDSHKIGLYEHSAPRDPDFLKKPENQKYLDAVSRYYEMHKKIAKQAELEMQSDSLKIPESWDIADMYLEDIMKNSGDFEKLISNYEIDGRLSEAPTAEEVRDYLAKSIITETDEEHHKMFVHRRNDILLEKLDEKLSEESDIAILYGITHLTGINDGILNRGFKRIDIKWIPCW